MKIYDYSFLEYEPIPNKTMSLIVAIEKVKGEGLLYQLKYPTLFQKLENIAIIQSVKASNEIEGIVTSDKRIKSIVQDNVAPIGHDEEEIAGYRDVLRLIHEGYKGYAFQKPDILAFHRQLLSYTGYDFGGLYKQDDNLIIEQDQLGRRSIRFKPVQADKTTDAMEQLELAYIEARDNSRISNLLLIPCVVLDFLCIHPFRDGNGRMSRLLSLLLLYKSGYIVGKYVSFESVINMHKSSYYGALKTASVNWHENHNDYYAFIDNFLETLLTCYRELYRRFEIVSNQKNTKTARIEDTINASILPISRQEIFEMWPDISMETIKKVIKTLLEQGKVEKIGNYKDATYRKLRIT